MSERTVAILAPTYRAGMDRLQEIARSAPVAPTKRTPDGIRVLDTEFRVITDENQLWGMELTTFEVVGFWPNWKDRERLKDVAQSRIRHWTASAPGE